MLNLAAVAVTIAALVCAWRVITNSRTSRWWFVFAILLTGIGATVDGVSIPLGAIRMLLAIAVSPNVGHPVRGDAVHSPGWSLN